MRHQSFWCFAVTLNFKGHVMSFYNAKISTCFCRLSALSASQRIMGVCGRPPGGAHVLVALLRRRRDKELQRTAARDVAAGKQLLFT